MGGSAFASGPHALSTPRMPPAVYEAVRERCKAALRRLFVCVASPIEGPAKRDHGDVDIYVALTRRAVFGAAGGDDGLAHNDNVSPLEAAAAAVARALGAERSIVAADASCHFAVPWPAELAEGPEGQARRFVQVDVRICSSIPQLQWLLFKHAHGDLWSVLGSVIRPCGLTVDDEALWVRIPEIEAHNRRRAKVFLTADPAAALRFLGLAQDGGVWERPFATVEAMFEYAATCRFFRVEPRGEGAQGGEAEADRQRLRSNDRRRLATRDVYRRWADEFVPQCRARGRFPAGAAAPTRDAVRREALASFGLARWFYEKRLADWRRERQEEEVWRSAIKGTVPEDLDPQHRGVLCSALKKIVMQDDASFGVARGGGGGGSDAGAFRDEEGWYRVDEVRAWVAQHWREVEAVAWQRQLERARDNLRLREAKCNPAVGGHAYDHGASRVPIS